MSATGYSAGVDGMYSSVGLVQSKLSNILGHEKAGTLVGWNTYIYSNILIVDIISICLIYC